ncbi:hypothetical protein KUL152_00140 [Tenacibaculum sp. KUL152]|uniref:hypothetical protein n=1 Tax=unclassified Alteromonas TaxID=2614992 RepID=UPI0012E5633B|nr:MULTISPECIES: hypothetical protein [unclassified Alteromonas]BCO18480.1 hypothetical protein KUC3_13370 [Alteromonas sp. KC3]BCO22441.1 hypothetical protein KUC14_13100 [Alteromonas sp. KC14]GFD87788.1 hypothetical protein KUL152_00140 [Tenacibaculum sp. KUL152]
MSAVQLLEQLGANADLQANKQIASAILDQIGEQNEKMWCFMVPAEEDGEDNKDKDKDGEETEDKKEIKLQ